MSLRARKEQQQLQASVLKMAAAVSPHRYRIFVQLARNMSGPQARSGLRGRGCCPAWKAARTLALVISDALVPNIGTRWSHAQRGPSRCSAWWRITIWQSTLVAHRRAVTGQAYARAAIVRQCGQTYRRDLCAVSPAASQADLSPPRCRSLHPGLGRNRPTEADAHIRRQASLLDEKAQDAIVVRELHGRVTFWNKSAERLYGRPATRPSGQPIETLLYRDRVTSTQPPAPRSTRANGPEIVPLRPGRQAIDMEGAGRWCRANDNEPGLILGSIPTSASARPPTARSSAWRSTTPDRPVQSACCCSDRMQRRPLATPSATTRGCAAVHRPAGQLPRP